MASAMAQMSKPAATVMPIRQSQRGGNGVARIRLSSWLASILGVISSIVWPFYPGMWRNGQQ